MKKIAIHVHSLRIPFMKEYSAAKAKFTAKNQINIIITSLSTHTAKTSTGSQEPDMP